MQRDHIGHVLVEGVRLPAVVVGLQCFAGQILKHSSEFLSTTSPILQFNNNKGFEKFKMFSYESLRLQPDYEETNVMSTALRFVFFFVKVNCAGENFNIYFYPIFNGYIYCILCKKLLYEKRNKKVSCYTFLSMLTALPFSPGWLRSPCL